MRYKDETPFERKQRHASLFWYSMTMLILTAGFGFGIGILWLHQ